MSPSYPGWLTSVLRSSPSVCQLLPLLRLCPKGLNRRKTPVSYPRANTEVPAPYMPIQSPSVPVTHSFVCSAPGSACFLSAGLCSPTSPAAAFADQTEPRSPSFNKGNTFISASLGGICCFKEFLFKLNLFFFKAVF